MGKKLVLAPLLSVLLIAFAMGIGGLGGPLFDRAHADGERGTLYIDVLPDASNTTSGYGTIDVCRGGLAIGDTFDVDIVIHGANDLAGPYWILYYNKDVLKVTAYDWSNWKMGAGGIDICDALPDTDGQFACTYAQDTGVSGDGVLARVTFQAVANGSSDLALCTITGNCPDLADSAGQDHFYPEALVDHPADTLRVAVGQSCSEAPPPPPLPTQKPAISAPAPTPAGTAAHPATATPPAAAATAKATLTPVPLVAGGGGLLGSDDGFPWVAVCESAGAGVVALAALGLLVGLARRR
jgi:hypothetical protein